MRKNFKPAMGRGDDGTTSLLTGTRVSKTDVRVKTNAVMDELSSWLGLARARKASGSAGREQLREAQKTLAEASSHIAGLDRSAILSSRTRSLELEIRRLDSEQGKLKSFLLPGTNEREALLHLARARCRSAEILAWHVKKAGPCAVYLNRLSDYLFLLAVKAR
jgi:cob(I)alamin adenosyltransferase